MIFQPTESIRVSIFRFKNNFSFQGIDQSALTGNTEFIREIIEMCIRDRSTVHKDVTERLLIINPPLARQARSVLDVNKSERHIRGGLATREKYRHIRDEKCL